MKSVILIVALWCFSLFSLSQGGDLTVEIPQGCKINGLSDGSHYISIRSPKLSSYVKNNKNTDLIESQTVEEIQQIINEDTNMQEKESQIIKLIDSSNPNSNSKSDDSIVYLLTVQCYNGDMYIESDDYSLLFDDVFTPSKGYTVTEIMQSEKKGKSERDPMVKPGDTPLTQKSTTKTVKWTAEYIVWLVLIIMVGVFGLGIFMLLYWWCCHARTYRLVDTSNFPNAAYTQLPSTETNVYGSTEVAVDGPTNQTTQAPPAPAKSAPIDDTMVSQTVTVEQDVLP